MNKKYLLLLISCFTLSLDAAHDRLGFSSPSQRLVTYVSQSKFLKSGGTSLQQTFSINTPGTYVLTENINSSVGGGEVIYINTDNVTLDLGGNNIKLSGTNGDASAIKISASIDNVEIRNGSISNMKLAGIDLGSGQVTNLRIKDIYFDTCNTSGTANYGALYFKGGSITKNSVVSVEDCQFYNITSNNSESAYGIYAIYTDYLTVKNCSFNGIQTTGDGYNGYGIYLQDSEYPIFESTNIHLTKGDEVAAGFYLLTCTGAQINDCNSLGAKAADTTTGDAYGFYFENTNNSAITNCTSINNTAPVAASGFYITSCQNNSFIECTASGNEVISTTVATNATGFQTSQLSAAKGPCQSCYFHNCTAFGQKATSDTDSVAAGFLMHNTKYSIIDHCTAFGNIGRAGTGVGIYLDDRVTTDTVDNCIVSHCRAHCNTSSTTGKAYGIFDERVMTSDNIIYECYGFVNIDTSGGTATQNISIAAATDTDLSVQLYRDKYTAMTAASQKAMNVMINAADSP